MIRYEELVSALTKWRERNGLPTTPTDYGHGAATEYIDQAQAAPDEVYDLSEDSGLIVAEDVRAQAGTIDTQDEDADPYGDGDADTPAPDLAAASDRYRSTDSDYDGADGVDYGASRGETLEVVDDDQVDEMVMGDDDEDGSTVVSDDPVDDEPPPLPDPDD
jgi:hypothetical protein